MKNVMMMVLVVLVMFSSSLYINQATIISSNDNMVVCEDNTGNIWSYFGNTTKTTVSLVMYNNNSENPTDDIIISAY